MAISGVLHIAPGSLTAVDSAATLAVGTQAFDGDGNQYIYLKGVASTAIGSAATYDELGVTALTVANAVGPVAVAMAAIVANKYGWYLINGTGSVLTAGDVGDNGNVYLTATPGALDDALVAGDRVKGMLFRAARTGAGLVACQLFGGAFVDDITD